MNLMDWLELGAVLVSAVFGILQARRAGLDPLGVIVLALVVAFGGGTLRDLFLDRQPLFWIGKPNYTLAVFGLATLSCFVPRIPDRIARWLDLPDAIGMGLFTVVGMQIACDAGVAPFVAVLLGVITGTFGGVISDVLCNQVPRLFRPAGPLYATCSFVGAWVCFLADLVPGLPDWTPLAAGVLTAVALRMGAIHFNIRLPELGPGENAAPSPNGRRD
jgi:uncharacterized membrane protein YeiH